MAILFALLYSAMLGESFAVFSFVFEVKMEILAKIWAEKWRGLAPPVPTPMASSSQGTGFRKSVPYESLILETRQHSHRKAC